MKKYLFLFSCLAFASSLFAQSAPPKRPSVVWEFNSLENMSGNIPKFKGSPELVDFNETRKALALGGDDAFLINNYPLANYDIWMFEFVLQPAAGGPAEQTALHMKESEGEGGVIIRVRVVGDQWYPETILKWKGQEISLSDEEKLYPVGEWRAVGIGFDGQRLIQWVDSQEIDSAPCDLTRLQKGMTAVGCNMGQTSWFTGTVREVRFSPKLLPIEHFLKP